MLEVFVNIMSLQLADDLRKSTLVVYNPLCERVLPYIQPSMHFGDLEWVPSCCRLCILHDEEVNRKYSSNPLHIRTPLVVGSQLSSCESIDV